MALLVAGFCAGMSFVCSRKATRSTGGRGKPGAFFLPRVIRFSGYGGAEGGLTVPGNPFEAFERLESGVPKENRMTLFFPPVVLTAPAVENAARANGAPKATGRKTE